MALKVIYTIFIGILIAIFVGVGISAYYPSPQEPDYPSTLKVYNLPTSPECDDRISLDLVKQQRDYDLALQKYEKKMQLYNRNISIVSLIFAVLILSISLLFYQRLLILADGLLLGGVVTLLYSIARVFGSGDDRLRFYIVGIGLLISIILGYLKFIRVSNKKSS